MQGFVQRFSFSEPETSSSNSRSFTFLTSRSSDDDPAGTGVLIGLWNRVTAGVAIFGSGSASSAAQPQPQATPQPQLQATPQILYFMGSTRPSTTTTATTSNDVNNATMAVSTPVVTTTSLPSHRVGHAKLLSMVAEGSESSSPSSSDSDDDETSPSSPPTSTHTTRLAFPSSAATPISNPTPTPKNVQGYTSPPGRTLPLTSRYLDPYTSLYVPSSSNAIPAVPPNSPMGVGGGGVVSAAPVDKGTQGGVDEGQANEEEEDKDDDDDEDLSNPTTLAKKLQELIDALPPPPVFNDLPSSPSPYPGSPAPSPYPGSPQYPGSPYPDRLPPPPPPRIPKRDPGTGRPIPPKDALPELGEGEGGGEGREGKGRQGRGRGKERVLKRVVEWLWDAGVMNGVPGSSPVPGSPSPVPGTPNRGGNGNGKDKRGKRAPEQAKSVWQVLESFPKKGHIPSTPYTGGGGAGGDVPGRVVPLPPVDDDGSNPLPNPEDEWKSPPFNPGDNGIPIPIPPDEEENNKGWWHEGDSVMLYSPLLPSALDIVEMGDVVGVVVEEDVGQDGSPGPPSSRLAVPGPGPSINVNPFVGWLTSLGPPSALPVRPQAKAQAQERTVTYTSPDNRTRHVRLAEVRAWAPSVEKMSVEVFWWGYRIYLPPPALLILSDKTIEAKKRADMITTALTWFFNNLPVSALPLALQPTVLLLQRLAPYLGYVGTFISWSWQQIKSYDVGNGVILTATWLLPIALIPGTWWDHSFPKSPAALRGGGKLPLPPVSVGGGGLFPPIGDVGAIGSKDGEDESTEGAPTESYPSSATTSPGPRILMPTALSSAASASSTTLVASASSGGGEVPGTATNGAGGGKGRSRKTSLSAAIAAFVGRKAKVERRMSVPVSTSVAGDVGSGEEARRSVGASATTTTSAMDITTATTVTKAAATTPTPTPDSPALSDNALAGGRDPLSATWRSTDGKDVLAFAAVLGAGADVGVGSGSGGGSSLSGSAVRGGVNPKSSLGQELVRSWRVGTVPLPNGEAEDVKE